MREIKFRVWTGMGMEYNVTVGKFGAFYVNPGAKCNGLDEKDSASLNPFNTIYSEQAPVMQFTGLKDKNGLDIYEGDLMDWDVPMEVKFKNGCFSIEGGGKETLLLGINSQSKVIGNIWEGKKEEGIKTTKE